MSTQHAPDTERVVPVLEGTHVSTGPLGSCIAVALAPDRMRLRFRPTIPEWAGAEILVEEGELVVRVGRKVLGRTDDGWVEVIKLLRSYGLPELLERLLG